ncbi:MAG: hypothetical protein V1709_11405 [Planctomycetota bacterium]
MRKLWFLFIPVCLALNCQSQGEVFKISPEPQIIKLQYIDNEDNIQKYTELFNPRTQFGYFTEKAPDSSIKDANYNSKKPLYGKINLGQGEDTIINAVLDKSDSSLNEYDLLWVDTNNNEDLSDEKPIQLCPNQKNKNSKESAFSLSIEYKSRKDYPCKILFNALQKREGDEKLLFTYKVISYYLGKVNIDNEPYQFILYDGNSNGIYNDMNDPILIKLEEATRDNEIRYNTVINLKNKLYSFELNESGTEVKWEPYTKPFGQLKPDINFTNFNTKIDYLEVYSPASKNNTNFRKPTATELKLPVGSYNISRTLFSLTDSNGKTLQLYSQNGNPVIIKNNETTEVKFGPPFNMEVQLKKTEYQRGEEIIISKNIMGCNGENYSFRFLKGEEEAQRVKVVIEDEKGKPVEGVKPKFG